MDKWGFTTQCDKILPQGGKILSQDGKILPQGGKMLPQYCKILSQGGKILPQGGKILPQNVVGGGGIVQQNFKRKKNKVGCLSRGIVNKIWSTT